VRLHGLGRNPELRPHLVVREPVGEELEQFEALAEVAALAGRRAEATDALGQALALYEQKGNLLAAETASTKLAGLST